MGSIGLQCGDAIQGDRLVVSIRIAQGDCCRVRPAGRRGIDHSDDLAAPQITGINTGSVNREHAAFIIQGHSHCAIQFLTFDGECSGSGLVNIGIHIQL